MKELQITKGALSDTYSQKNMIELTLFGSIIKFS